MTEIVEVVPTMITNVQHTITEWLHSIQLDNTTEDVGLLTVPALPPIDTNKVLRIGFQNAHGAHPTYAHDKWNEAMEKARDLQLGIFGLSELNTNVQLPMYKRQLTARVKEGFPSSHVAMITCKDNQATSTKQGGVLLAASLGHERRIRNSGGDPEGMGSFSYVTMEAAAGNKLTVISVYRPCEGNAEASGGTIWKQQWSRAQVLGKGEEYSCRITDIIHLEIADIQ